MFKSGRELADKGNDTLNQCLLEYHTSEQFYISHIQIDQSYLSTFFISGLVSDKTLPMNIFVSVTITTI